MPQLTPPQEVEKLSGHSPRAGPYVRMPGEFRVYIQGLCAGADSRLNRNRGQYRQAQRLPSIISKRCIAFDDYPATLKTPRT